MSTFQNREEEIEGICAPTDPIIMLDVYGEAGIGKSRLLDEAAQRIRVKRPGALVVVRFRSSADTLGGRSDSNPSGLSSQEQDSFDHHWRNIGHKAGQVVAQLDLPDGWTPVVLIYNTAEGHQVDRELGHRMYEQQSVPENTRLIAAKDIFKLQVQQEVDKGDNRHIALTLILKKWPRGVPMILTIAILVLVLLLVPQFAPTLISLLKVLISAL
jgi:hypothetical protein